MIDQLATSDLRRHVGLDAFSVWLRRDLLDRFGKIDAVPDEMLALIDASSFDEP